MLIAVALGSRWYLRTKGVFPLAHLFIPPNRVLCGSEYIFAMVEYVDNYDSTANVAIAENRSSQRILETYTYNVNHGSGLDQEFVKTQNLCYYTAPSHCMYMMISSSFVAFVPFQSSQTENRHPVARLIRYNASQIRKPFMSCFGELRDHLNVSFA